MSHWEYRIVQTHVAQVGFIYGLHTVYFDDNDQIIGWDLEPDVFYSESVEGLRNDILMALGDAQQPIYVAKGKELVLLPGQTPRVSVRRKLKDFLQVLNIYRIFL